MQEPKILGANDYRALGIIFLIIAVYVDHATCHSHVASEVNEYTHYSDMPPRAEQLEVE